MRYKKSCFNPTLAKHNLKRFWPLPVLILALFALAMIPDYYTSMFYSGHAMYLNPYTPHAGIVSDTSVEQALRTTRNAIYSLTTLVILVQLFTALVSALLVMHHIHGRKQIQFYHGLPLSRRCLYFTNVLSGYLMGLVPVLLVELILMLMALGMGAEAFPALQLMGVTAASFTAFYAIAIIGCVLAGQSFGAVLLYAGMHCFVIAISAGGAGVARFILPGFDTQVLLELLTRWLTPIWIMLDSAAPLYTDTGLGLPYGYPLLPFVIYAATGILLLVLGGFLYQRRRGETAGEMISFPFIRLLCKVLVALMAGLGGTVALVALMNFQQEVSFPVVTLLVMGLLILGWIAAEMVIRKTFRVFQKVPMAQCLSLSALVLLILLGARLDVAGYVNCTPDLTRVSEARIMVYGTSVSVDPTDALQFHETILDHQEELSNNTSYYGNTALYLSYYDEDGCSILDRTYYLRDDMANQIITEFLSLMSTPEYNYASWFDGQDPNLTQDHIAICQLTANCRYYNENGYEQRTPYLLKEGKQMVNDWEIFSPADGLILYDAIVRDIQEGNLESFFHRYFSGVHLSYGTIDFTTYHDLYDPAEGTYQEYLGQTIQNYTSFEIYDSMTHTLSALESLGITVNTEALESLGITVNTEALE